jgi:hypothetical protein
MTKDKKAKEKKKKDRDQKRLKLKKSRQKQRSKKIITGKAKPDMQFVERPPISAMDAPKGFRAISTNQAIFDYAEPIMQYIDPNDPKGINKGFGLATQIWNYTLTVEDGKEDIKLKKDILKVLISTIKMTSDEAVKFLMMMIERKNHLLPPDIQPEQMNVMFIRKEVSHLIKEFDYSKIEIPDEPIPPDGKDKKLVENIRRIDTYITDGADYSEWEKDCIAMEEECSRRFKKWLNDKGLHDELVMDFPFHVEMFLTFIYRYFHDEIVLVNSVTEEYFAEFYLDYILRKVVAKPHEYILYMPSIKLFYKFLFEKQYLDDPEPVIRILDNLEPVFMKILRERFS